MKSWIKETIKSQNMGYLTISDRSNIRILPFMYSYDRGHLKGSLSIIQAKILDTLRRYPIQQIVITHHDKIIKISGTVRLDQDDLDNAWKSYHNYNDLLKKESHQDLFERIPHLQKRVIIDIVPTKIEATDGQEEMTYEMEIL